MSQKTLEQLRNRDYRHQVLELRALTLEGESTDMVIEGRAIVFDQETVLFKINGNEYKEVIKKGALDNCDSSQCFLKFNHDDNQVVARTKNRTLELDIRVDGVYIRAKLANTTAGRDLYELVKSGIVDKMSFAFNQTEESFNEETRTWTVHKIGKLWDVAAVAHPAYQDTDLYARRLEEVETKRVQEVEAMDLRNKKELEEKRNRIRAMIREQK
jgi:HK97 family phage prohead protease